MQEAGAVCNGEEWRPVVGYEGWYEVSDTGEVRRVDAKRRLKAAPAKVGYRIATLCRPGAESRLYLHQIVAAAFIGPCPPGLVVNHIDGDKLRNVPSNLEYVSRSRNNQHAWETGLMEGGVRNGHARLTPADVAAIRQAKGELTVRALAERYGISNGHVCNIQNRKYWRQEP